MKHQHYYRDVTKYKKVDFYRLAALYGINDPCFQHVFKKILAVGNRGHKDMAHDVQDMIDTLVRWQDMQREDALIAESPEWQDKELASSGIYGDAGCTPEDQQAASLVHDYAPKTEQAAFEDWLEKTCPSGCVESVEAQWKMSSDYAEWFDDAELNPDLVALCANTTIHADEGGWRVQVGDKCPIAEMVKVQVEWRDGSVSSWCLPNVVNWGYVTKWRYANKEQ